MTATALFSGAANAAVNFSDSFDAESPPGVSILNYTGFANWDVVGQVDLVASPNGFDLDGSGNYVDLDGSSGPGAIVSKQSFSLSAGDFVTWSFAYSGNQRDRNSDTIVFGLDFDGAGTAQNLTLNGINYGDFAYASFNHTINSFVIGPDQGWATVTYTFTALNDVSLKLYFGTTSGDNVGPLIDDVLLRTGAIPEPSTWAMMILGFGAAGALLRRRSLAAT